MAGKSMKPGGGGRFAAMVASGVPPGAAAAAGRKKYGAKKMAKWAVAGKKRAEHGNKYPHKYNGVMKGQ
jgi:hypothetical protein